MLLINVPTTLLAFAALASALPNNLKNVEKRSTEQQILKALAGTYSLVNTTR
jgi:hypothetical protein